MKLSQAAAVKLFPTHFHLEPPATGQLFNLPTAFAIGDWPRMGTQCWPASQRMALDDAVNRGATIPSVAVAALVQRGDTQRFRLEKEVLKDRL